MKHVCPKCGTPVINALAHGVTFVVASGVVTYEGRTCRLSPMQIDTLETLLDAYPGNVPAATLFAALYSERTDSETPPDSRSMTSMICNMRRRFREAGIAIEIASNKCGWGHHNGYALTIGTVGTEDEQAKVA